MSATEAEPSTSQTEDKGLANPKIETLIYVGGEILDNYRSSYEDLLGGARPPITSSRSAWTSSTSPSSAISRMASMT